MRSCEGACGRCCSTSSGLCTSWGVATCAQTGAALKTAALHRTPTATRAGRIMICSSGFQSGLVSPDELSCGKTEIAENFGRRSRSVERVEVQSWRTFAQEFLALQRCVFDPKPDHFLIVAAGFQTADDDRGQIGAAERDETPDL